MSGAYLAQAVFVDTSAVVALKDKQAQHHEDAQRFWDTASGIVWASLNATAQETYTRARFRLGFRAALSLYDLLKGENVVGVSFSPADEIQARLTLARFKEHDLSFHDALLAMVMKRLGGYRVFTFDHHFYLFGFEVLPGAISLRHEAHSRGLSTRRKTARRRGS
jgi:predicted nucleic acid-binding protein